MLKTINADQSSGSPLPANALKFTVLPFDLAADALDLDPLEFPLAGKLG